MARNLLYEESAICARPEREARRYMIFHVISIIFLIVGVLTFLNALSFIPSFWIEVEGEEAMSNEARIFGTVMWVGFVLSLFGLGLAFWKLKSRFNQSYDYTFVEDELRITRVFNGRKRKPIAKLTAEGILKIGWCDKDSFEDTLRGLNGKRPRFMTPNHEPAEGKEFVYVLASEGGDKTMYVLECKRELLEYLVQAAGRTKLERG